MRRLLVLLTLIASTVPAGATAPSRSAPFDPLLRSVLSTAAPAEQIVVVANYRAPLDAGQVADLRATGAVAMAYPSLPMAAVVATPRQIERIATLPDVLSLYWNEPQGYDLVESQEKIGAQQVWDLGLHGEGVGIAILDTGVDASHPDLADHVVQNVKILGPEYLQQPTGTFDAVIVEDVITSDTTSGHGTHVAGDAAGDGTASEGKFRGPAFEADIIGLGAGEGLNIFTALSGFAYAIEHRDDYNIKVISNSWGTSFRLVDPEHPVVRASKAAVDAGISVVFSAGNRYEEMTLTPYAAPWNITVAAGAKVGGLTSFSSKGLEFDDLPMVSDPAQTDFVGTTKLDGVGLYHPSVTGIGDSVHSARAPATVVSALGAGSGDEELSPTELPYYTTASGTSMSAPQVSGLLAVVQQAFHAANPSVGWLTPAQVKQVLQISAAPMDGLKFFQQGYGLIDAPAAVALAQSLTGSAEQIDAALGTQIAAINADVSGSSEFQILTSYAWRRPTLDSVGNLSKHSFTLDVPGETDRVKALVSFPTTTQLNVASVDLYLFDASSPRREIARATASNFSHGIQRIDVDLTALTQAPTPGEWLLEARGDISSNCFVGTIPRCNNPVETWVAAQALDAASAAPGKTFLPTGELKLFMHNESEGEQAPPGLVKEGYRWDGDLVGGDLSAALPDNPRAGFAGYAHTYAPVIAKRAVFTSAPLEQTVTVGRNLLLDMFLQGEGSVAGRGSIGYWLYEVQPDDTRKLISSEELITPFDYGLAPVANHKTFPLAAPYTYSAGGRVEIELAFSAGVSSGMRFYYDAPAEPAALTLTTGVLE